jgi:hypothetical protein
MRILGGAVELRSGLERLKLPGHGRVLRLGEQRRHFRGTHGLERSSRFNRLIEDRHAFTAGNHYRCREVQRVVAGTPPALHARSSECCRPPMDFIPSTPMPCSTSFANVFVILDEIDMVRLQALQ